MHVDRVKVGALRRTENGDAAKGGIDIVLRNVVALRIVSLALVLWDET